MHYFKKEHLPIGDIRLVIDDGSAYSANYIAMLEKTGYQLYVDNDKINLNGLSRNDKFKAIYQKKILYQKVKSMNAYSSYHNYKVLMYYCQLCLNRVVLDIKIQDYSQIKKVHNSDGSVE